MNITSYFKQLIYKIFLSVEVMLLLYRSVIMFSFAQNRFTKGMIYHFFKFNKFTVSTGVVEGLGITRAYGYIYMYFFLNNLSELHII